MRISSGSAIPLRNPYGTCTLRSEATQGRAGNSEGSGEDRRKRETTATTGTRQRTGNRPGSGTGGAEDAEHQWTQVRWPGWSLRRQDHSRPQGWQCSPDRLRSGRGTRRSGEYRSQAIRTDANARRGFRANQLPPGNRRTDRGMNANEGSDGSGWSTLSP
jgi:hypothetical protein